jgi:hypothetical protein
MAPAARRRATAVASSSARRCLRETRPELCGIPRRANASLIEHGTPCSGPRCLPGGDLLIGAGGVAQGLLEALRHQRVEVRVHLLHVANVRADDLVRGELPRADAPGELGGGEEQEIVQHGCSSHGPRANSSGLTKQRRGSKS